MNHDSPIPHEELDAIERFLKNEMSPTETMAFQNRMQADDLLRARVSEMRLLIIGIQESAISERLNDFHKGITQRPILNMRFRRWLVAAAVIAVAGSAVIYFFNGHRSAEQTFAAYYQPDPGLISSMGAADNYDFDRAMVDYKKGDYNKSLNAWHELNKRQPGNDTLQYFIGSAYLALGNAKNAAPYFREVLADSSSAFASDASWYLGLSLLRLDDPTAAIPFIQRSVHPARNEILQKLEKK